MGSSYMISDILCIRGKEINENQDHHTHYRHGAGVLDIPPRIVGHFAGLINLKANITGIGIVGNFLLDVNVCSKYLNSGLVTPSIIGTPTLRTFKFRLTLS